MTNDDKHGDRLAAWRRTPDRDPVAQFEAGWGALPADDPATWTLQIPRPCIEGLHTIMNRGGVGVVGRLGVL